MDKDKVSRTRRRDFKRKIDNAEDDKISERELLQDNIYISKKRPETLFKKSTKALPRIATKKAESYYTKRVEISPSNAYKRSMHYYMDKDSPAEIIKLV